MNIYEKLLAIQTELKAPKSQFNKFGGYNYRNCEDILESAKPLLAKHKAVLYLSDTVEEIGGRIYVKATAVLVDVEKPSERLLATAYAREEESKKGMDGSQVTGASSSYARKYALNGLFDIDDTKDSDTTNQQGKGQNQPQNKGGQQKPKPQPQMKKQVISDDMRNRLNTAISNYKALVGGNTKDIVADIEEAFGKTLADFTENDGQKTLELINEWQRAFTE